MIAHGAYLVALAASFVWFAMGFRYFSTQPAAAAKVMIPKSARDTPLFLTFTAAVRFLGGFNAAFALMSLLLLSLALAGSPLFTAPGERAIALLILASAHFSQFYFNLPVLRNGERQGEAYWPVLSGPMLMIFVVDAGQTVICLGAALLQLAA
ncbi:MAG: hypothetical protein AAGH45_12260 [Pseudomonadota bacterium]